MQTWVISLTIWRLDKNTWSTWFETIEPRSDKTTSKLDSSKMLFIGASSTSMTLMSWRRLFTRICTHMSRISQLRMLRSIPISRRSSRTRLLICRILRTVWNAVSRRRNRFTRRRTWTSWRKMCSWSCWLPNLEQRSKNSRPWKRTRVQRRKCSKTRQTWWTTARTVLVESRLALALKWVTPKTSRQPTPNVTSKR